MFAAGSIIWAAHWFYVFSSISFCFRYSYTCGRLSWPVLWSTFRRNIKIRITTVICARQTGHPTSITDTPIAHASQNRACPHGTSAKPACGATRHTSHQSSEVVAAAAVADSDAPKVIAARAPACPCLRPCCCCCCCCCCRPAAVGTPYERRQNGWLHAETTGDYKRCCRIVTNRISFVRLSFSTFNFFLGRRMFNPLRSV